MRVLRGLGGALLWILASLLGLVGVVLCVTIILLPVGIPLLRLARRLWTSSVQLMLPRAVAHPAKETQRRGRRKRVAVLEEVGSRTKKVRKRTRKRARAMSKRARKGTRRQRKKLVG